MSYATRAQLEALLPRRGGEAAFAPLTTSQVDGIMAGVAAELDAIVAAGGIPVPVTEPATLVAHLVQLELYGSVAMVQKARFQDPVGLNSDGTGPFYAERYKDGLAQLSDIAHRLYYGVPQSSSYTTSYPDDAEPILSVDTVW